jgi:hypothetical protein
MALRDAWDASGRGSMALGQGEWGEAASQYGNLATALAGAIPGAGIIARGTKRGAQWMDRNLPASFNRLLDAAMPSDPRSTTFSGAGPTSKAARQPALDKPIYQINDTGFGKLDDVKEEMARFGRPDIRVVDMGDHYMALEGSHRLQAAYELGLVPDLTVIKQTDKLNPHDYDWGHNQMLDYLHEEGMTAGDIASVLRDTSQNSFVDFRVPRKK